MNSYQYYRQAIRYPWRSDRYTRGSTVNYNGAYDPEEGIDKPSFIRTLLLDVACREHPSSAAFGWLRANYYDTLVRQTGGQAWANDFVAVGNTYDQLNRSRWIFSHELLAHIFKKIGDENDHGGPPRNDQVGWDVGNVLGFGKIKPDGEFDDLRKAQSLSATRQTVDNWLGVDTYHRIEPISVKRMCPSGSGTQNTRFILGSIPDDSQLPWEIESSYSEMRPGIVTPSDSGMGEVRVLDNQYNLLYSSKFTYDPPMSEGNFVYDGGFFVVVPAMSNEHRVEIYRDTDLQDSRERSSHSPQLTVTSPQSGQTIGSSLTISWQASDTDGDPLTAKVSYSPDGGITWWYLSRETPETSITASLDDLSASTNALVRVLVTDGFNSTISDITGLIQPTNHLPEPSIVLPESPDQQWGPGVVILLEGFSSDLEDDMSDSDTRITTLTWYSDLDGLIGNGGIINWKPSALGTHILELRATDSHNGSNSVFVTLAVVP